MQEDPHAEPLPIEGLLQPETTTEHAVDDQEAQDATLQRGPDSHSR
mgnify:CR=1 FL=1